LPHCFVSCRARGPGGYLGKRATKGCKRTPVMQKLLRAVGAQRRLVIPDEVRHGRLPAPCPPAPHVPWVPPPPQLPTVVPFEQDVRDPRVPHGRYVLKGLHLQEVWGRGQQVGPLWLPEVPTKGPVGSLAPPLSPTTAPEEPASDPLHPLTCSGTLQGHQRQRKRRPSVPPAREGRDPPWLPPAPQARIRWQGLVRSGGGTYRCSSGHWHLGPRCAWHG
jgi:hypothetical protein